MDTSLSRLTLVMLTRNRKSFMRRSFNYWVGKNVNLMIFDGSEEEDEKLRHYQDSNIKYFHMPGHYYFDRLKHASDLVETEFVSMICDDEFFTISGISACIDELDQHEELVCCSGRSIRFWTENNIILGYDQYPELRGYALLQDTPEERAYRHFADYMSSTVYGVARKDAWKSAIAAKTARTYSDFSLTQETIFEMTMALNGKSKVLPHLFWFRSGENLPMRNDDPAMMKNIPHFWQWWIDHSDDLSRTEYVERIINASLIKNKSAVAVRNGVMDGFSVFCENKKIHMHGLAHWQPAQGIIITPIDEALNKLKEQGCLVPKNDTEEILYIIRSFS